MNGVETTALTSGEALEGLVSDVWDYRAGIYPALKTFADETKVDAARKVIAKAVSGEIFSELASNVELDGNAAWSLSDGSAFKIENGVLIVPHSSRSLHRHLCVRE